MSRDDLPDAEKERTDVIAHCLRIGDEVGARDTARELPDGPAVLYEDDSRNLRTTLSVDVGVFVDQDRVIVDGLTAQHAEAIMQEVA